LAMMAEAVTMNTTHLLVMGDFNWSLANQSQHAIFRPANWRRHLLWAVSSWLFWLFYLLFDCVHYRYFKSVLRRNGSTRYADKMLVIFEDCIVSIGRVGWLLRAIVEPSLGRRTYFVYIHLLCVVFPAQS